MKSLRLPAILVILVFSSSVAVRAQGLIAKVLSFASPVGAWGVQSRQMMYIETGVALAVLTLLAVLV